MFSAGTDWRWVDGDSEEDLYNAAVPASFVGVTQQAVLATKRVSGGTQQSIGVFLQDIFTPVSKLAVTLSARVDYWRSYDGHNLETNVTTGSPTANHNPSLPEKSDNVVSPRVAAIYHVTDRVSAWGDYGLGFRAPTLNELYRQFSLGGTTTRPNNQLGPERLKGGELGINVAPAPNVTVRGTWFDNRIKDSVGNVTISANVQQRQNIGRTHVWGIQTDVEYRLGTSWRFSGGYLYDQAKVTENPSNPALVGKFLPQVPEHRGSWQASYTDRRYATVSVGMQLVGRQFDDDLNLRTVPPAALTEAGYDASTEPGLPGYAVFDLFVSRALGSNAEVYFGTQNLFDQQYFVQTNPSTFGTPRLVHLGIRLSFLGG
jgi:outer membrane receptor protein involved in Fe transport